MVYEQVVNVEKLLNPISEETPQGNDVREDRSPTSDYYTIKDARNAARAAERSAIFGDEPDNDLMGSWRKVSSVAERLLSTQTKDLEVSVWYLESLVRIHGIAGLRDGLLVINGLVSSFWEGLFPLPDEDGLETRVSCLTGLNGDGGEGTLLAPLRNLAIAYDDNGLGNLSFWQYLQARDVDHIEDEEKKAERIASLGYDLSTFTSAVLKANIEDIHKTIGTLEECVEIYASITASLRESCGVDAPPSSKITELLNEVSRTTRFIYKERLEQAQAAEQQNQVNEEEEISSSAESQTNVVQLAGIASGKINNREDALRRLEDVAKYFRQYEPHTPLAPAIERLVVWGRMTVAELMMELIPESNARSLFSQYTGVKLDGSDEHSYVAPPAQVATTNNEAPTKQPAESSAVKEEAATSQW